MPSPLRSQRQKNTSFESLLHQVLNHLDLVGVDRFTLGYIAGQCEKVFCEACPAAVFVIEEGKGLTWTHVAAVAEIYGLETVMKGKDAWVFHSAKTEDLIRLMGKNDHTIRGFLCGIPHHRIDPEWNPKQKEGP